MVSMRDEVDGQEKSDRNKNSFLCPAFLFY